MNSSQSPESAGDPALRRLRVYQESRTLAGAVTRAVARFPARHAALGDQMGRAATSIPLNIAEGHGRRTPRDKARYFDVARGSLSELRAQIDRANDNGLLSVAVRDELTKRSIWTARLLAGLWRSLE